jgi:VCBS repeat-containing protein
MAAIQITNINDNQSTAPYTGVPYTGGVLPNGVTNDNTLLIQGSVGGLTNTAVEIYVDNVLVGTVHSTTEVPLDGGTGSIWSYTATLGADGPHTVEAKGVGASTGLYNFTLDTTVAAPNTIKASSNFGATLGDFSAGATTEDATPTLRGNAEADSKILIYDNGGATAIAEATANGAGAWSVELPSSLSTDLHTLTFQQVDKAGNVSAPGSAFAFTVGGAVVPNTAPVATGETFAATEDTPLVVGAPGLLGNDTDANGDSLTALMVTGPAHGSLSFAPTGAFTYTPPANYNGTDSFTYKVNDGTADSNIVTVTLNVAAVNDAPVAAANTYAATEDTVLTVNAATGVLANDTDVDFNTLTAAVVTDPTHGVLALNPDGSFTYTPAANYNGTDSFTYKANDGSLNSAPVTVTLNVAAVNDAPVATGDAYAGTEDTSLIVGAPGALGNDTDVDGDPLALALVTGPAHGSLSYSADGSFTYTPPANYNGTDSFTYKANDGSLNSAPVTVTLTIVSVNDAPTDIALSANTVAENAAAGTVIGALSTTDVDTGDTHAYTITSGGDAFDIVGGNLVAKAGIDYEAGATRSVTVVSTDSGSLTTAKTFTINVTDLNDKVPVFTSAGTATTAENTTPATVVYTAATTDADGTAANRGVTYSLEGADATKFNINAATGAVTFKAAPDYEVPTDAGANNVYDVVVKATNVGVDVTQTATKSVAISVTDVNDNKPIITSAATASFAENGTGQAYKVIATDADASPAFNTITYSIDAGGDGALFNINATTGVITFKTSPNFEAPADSDKDNNYVVLVKASDGTFSSSQAVVVSVTNVFEPGEIAAGVLITSTDAQVKDSTPLITGQANTSLVGQTVTVFEGATARGTGVVQANGAWSIETGTVADGAHTYTAQLAGNVSNSVTLTIDTVVPVVTITGTTGAGFSPTIAGTASVADIGRTVSILDGATVVGTGVVGAGGAFSVTTGLTGTGTHSLTAQVVDLAGNVGTSTATAYGITPQPGQAETNAINAVNLQAAYINIMDAPLVLAKDAAFMSDLLSKMSLNLVTYKEALDAVIDRADGSTSVATLSYQFFTGKIPTKAGLDYLVSTTGGNTNNINSAYYQDFNIENRYINFAVNLGHDGEGKAGFQTKYGALNLFDATKKAYTEIFGTAATDAKVHEILDTTITVGNLTFARSVYFQAYGHDDVGTKAAMVGWLLSEAAKSDIGAYAKANEAFLNDLADGATFGVDLVGVYGVKAAPLVMQFEA